MPITVIAAQMILNMEERLRRWKIDASIEAVGQQTYIRFSTLRADMDSFNCRIPIYRYMEGAELAHLLAEAAYDHLHGNQEETK
jgi:hypothetical protein